MTTSLKNVTFKDEILLFLRDKPPSKPVAILHAFVDKAATNDERWFQSDEAKALVHTLNATIHGPNYRLNGKLEQQRLEKAFKDYSW